MFVGLFFVVKPKFVVTEVEPITTGQAHRLGVSLRHKLPNPIGPDYYELAFLFNYGVSLPHHARTCTSEDAYISYL